MRITEDSTFRYINFAPAVNLYSVIVPERGRSGYIGHFNDLDSALLARDQREAAQNRRSKRNE